MKKSLKDPEPRDSGVFNEKFPNRLKAIFLSMGMVFSEREFAFYCQEIPKFLIHK